MTSFTNFYETWFEQLHHLVHQLVAAHRPPTTPDHNYDLEHLVNKVMSHYTEYYQVKSVAAESDVLSVFAAPWATTLERSLHWMAGWRPTTVFHLIYSESSILFESHIIDILRGLRTGDLGDLSPSQFRRVSELQCETVREENGITAEFSEWQDSASELMNVSANVSEKIGRLVSVLRKADDLRLRTIQRVVELLTPQQAVEFLIAAAELQFGVRAWGVNHDRQRENIQ
ncbi:protein DOG1-like 4 [Humulus lupulus]|uniref:protein DOG1-like 4 n=1 Tax=Humulus lupulus TaxID=3486 RepID=UPI002B417407|nr:protein DOG1-like 4 [Humulus lupulus]